MFALVHHFKEQEVDEPGLAVCDVCFEISFTFYSGTSSISPSRFYFNCLQCFIVPCLRGVLGGRGLRRGLVKDGVH